MGDLHDYKRPSDAMFSGVSTHLTEQSPFSGTEIEQHIIKQIIDAEKTHNSHHYQHNLHSIYHNDSDDNSSTHSGMNANEEDEEDEEDYEDEASYTDYGSYYEENISMNDDSTDNNYEQLLALDEGVIKKGLSETEIKKFPTYIYLSSDHAAKPESCCIICLSAFEVGDNIREINCGHEFHPDCIDKWLGTSIKCPSCNKFLR